MSTRTIGGRVGRLLALALTAAVAAAAHPSKANAHIPQGLEVTQTVSVTPSSRAVPILMYHVIQRPNAGAPYPALFVSRAEFAAQMRWLARHGYEAVTLQRVYDAWHGRATLPRRPIVVSFDDGYRSHYTAALPVLRALGWPGVLNLDLSNVSGERGWWTLAPWMVRELIAAGWEVDAHSLTHADLPALSGDALKHEVQGSRAAIQSRFGVAANFFCYPSGHYDSDVVTAVRAAGFLGATTVEWGLGRRTEPLTLDRVRIDGGDGMSGLERKLASLGLL
jgi:peptidoglycan/xylan/chitin deacetylase (PgdA/CDA1 family)